MDQQRVFLSVPLVALELFGEQEQKQAYLDFYDQITQACEKRGMWVYPYQYGHPVEHDFIHEDVIYEETRQQIEDSDFVIAYVGIPSAGVSIGIEIANSLSLPVILLYEEGTKPLISKMILGCPAARDRIVAPDLESLIVKFDDRFNAVRQRISTVQVTGVSGVRDEFLKLLNTAHGESGLNLAQAGSRIGADRSYVFRLLKGEIQAPGRNQVIKLCVWAWKLDLKQTNAILKAGGYDDLQSAERLVDYMQRHATSILAIIFGFIGLGVLVSFQHEAATAHLCWNKGINPVTLPVAHQECEDSITWKDYFKRYNKVEGNPPRDEEIINRKIMQYSHQA